MRGKVDGGSEGEREEREEDKGKKNRKRGQGNREERGREAMRIRKDSTSQRKIGEGSGGKEGVTSGRQKGR